MDFFWGTRLTFHRNWFLVPTCENDRKACIKAAKMQVLGELTSSSCPVMMLRHLIRRGSHTLAVLSNEQLAMRLQSKLNWQLEISSSCPESTATRLKWRAFVKIYYLHW